MALTQVPTGMMADASVTPTKLSQPLTLGTSQATTSGTFVDFTSIPSWVKRITISFFGLSTNGTSSYLVQVGSGSVTSTGYQSMSSSQGGANTVSVTNSTAGFVIYSANASNSNTGHMVLTLVSGSSWLSSHNLGNYITGYYSQTGGGNVTLSGALDRIRITTVNGTDTFDAGTLNILYE